MGWPVGAPVTESGGTSGRVWGHHHRCPDGFAPFRNQLPPLPPLKTGLPPVRVGAEFSKGDNDLPAFFQFAPTAPTEKDRELEGCRAKGTPRPDLVRVDSAALADKLRPIAWGVIHPGPHGMGPSGPVWLRVIHTA